MLCKVTLQRIKPDSNKSIKQKLKVLATPLYITGTILRQKLDKKKGL